MNATDALTKMLAASDVSSTSGTASSVTETN